MKRIGAMVAVVALAPQICFRQRLDLQAFQPWKDEVSAVLSECIDTLYRIVRVRERFAKGVGDIDFATDFETAKSFQQQLAEVRLP